MLDIEYPIILAGMGGFGGPVSGPELVAAVSNAGGLGVLGCAFLPPDKIDELIKRTRSLTDKPFGVDTVLPAEVPKSGTTSEFKLELPEQGSQQADFVEELKKELGIPELQKKDEATMSDLAENTVWSGDLFKEEIEVILENRVPVYAAGLGDPGPYVDECHRRGIKVISVVGHTRAARRVVKSGVDIIVAQGIESGGHTSRIATMPLIPQVVDIVSPIPVVAAGGIGDGRGLVAALALGAVGVWCGTVFVATPESIYEDYLKERIPKESEDDTVVSRVITGKRARYLKNRLISAWEAKGLPTLPMPMQPIVILPILDSAWENKMADIVPAPAGQITGMIKEIKPAKQVVEEMVRGAMETLERLSAN
jgi:NAD(P)H-dependent flavin oxidoreductase YrpB (nitropropane dioxygenase family)